MKISKQTAKGVTEKQRKKMLEKLNLTVKKTNKGKDILNLSKKPRKKTP